MNNSNMVFPPSLFVGYFCFAASLIEISGELGMNAENTAFEDFIHIICKTLLIVMGIGLIIIGCVAVFGAVALLGEMDFPYRGELFLMLLGLSLYETIALFFRTRVKNKIKSQDLLIYHDNNPYLDITESWRP